MTFFTNAECILLVCMCMFMPSICWCNCLNVLYILHASLSCVCKYVMLSNIGGNKISIYKTFTIGRKQYSLKPMRLMFSSGNLKIIFPVSPIKSE